MYKRDDVSRYINSNDICKCNVYNRELIKNLCDYTKFQILVILYKLA